MKIRLKDHFSFTDRERNGSIVLLALIAGMTVFLFVQKNFIALPAEDFSQFDRFIATLEKNAADSSLSSVISEEKNRMPTVAEEAGQHSLFQAKTLFYFNPNGLSENDWVRLGLSPSQARVIKKYETKGGKFETKDDVKKMFVISAERYAELEPFIVLPEKTERLNSANSSGRTPSEKPETRNKEPRIVELNTADSTDLISINGIGPTFAKRILAYRERLGGFRTTEQLTEVFGMDEEHFAQVQPFVKTDSTYIRRINVNTASASELKKHPYIAPVVAQALVNYRKQHGPFRSVAEIRGCDLVNADLYRKIAPYLTI